MINYAHAKRTTPVATVAGDVSTLPRLADGRLSYGHPNRPALGTPPRVILRAGDSVTLTAQGARLNRQH